MTGLFSSLNTASSGLRAQQTALQTTSHNLSNTNTIGYSRQRVSMTANLPQSVAGIGQIGTGVLIGGVNRITDEFVIGQLQNEEASLTQHQQISDVLGQLEAIFNEPSDSGIAQQLSNFFVAWNNLASNPELTTAKTLVIRQSQTFLDTINHTGNKIDSLYKETGAQIKKEVLDFNSAADQLKAVNDQIFNATVKGEVPNDLLDRQDMLVGQMKNIGGVEVTKDKYGRAFVQLGGQEIITENEVNKLELSDPTTGAIAVSSADGPISIEVSSGSIKGFQEALVVVQETQEDLDSFVLNLANAVNVIHTDDGESDIPFFVFEADNVARTISINPELIDDPSLLNVGKDLENPIAGDGSRAKAIFNLQYTFLSEDAANWNYDEETMSFADDTTGSTLFNEYNQIVTNLGISKQQADNMVENQIDLVSLLEQRRDSISGVDINEEVVNLLQYQSAFQANSRAISTIAEMLDTLINKTGV